MILVHVLYHLVENQYEGMIICVMDLAIELGPIKCDDIVSLSPGRWG